MNQMDKQLQSIGDQRVRSLCGDPKSAPPPEDLSLIALLNESEKITGTVYFKVNQLFYTLTGKSIPPREFPSDDSVLGRVKTIHSIGIHIEQMLSDLKIHVEG